MKVKMLAEQELRLYEALGRLIRSARDHAELSQEEVAQRVGLTRTSITNIERGRQRIQVHMVYALAEALGVSLDTLLPSSSPYLPDDVDRKIPSDLGTEEREWVRRVLTTRKSG